MVDWAASLQYMNTYSINKYSVSTPCLSAGYIMLVCPQGTSCLSVRRVHHANHPLPVAGYIMLVCRRVHHANHPLSVAGYIMLGGWLWSSTLASLPLFGISDYRKFAICLPFEVEDIISKSESRV